MDLVKIKNELSKVLANLSATNPVESNNNTGNKVWTSTELSISSREIGGKVEVVGADGQKQSAPDGDYKMDDGFEFTVKNGLIDSIVGENPVQNDGELVSVDAATPVGATAADGGVKCSDPNCTDPNCTGDMPDAEPSPEIESLKETVAMLDERMTAIEEAIKTMTENMEKKASATEVDNFSNQLSELNETLKKIAKIPTQMSKVNNSDVVKDTYEQRLLELSELFSKK